MGQLLFVGYYIFSMYAKHTPMYPWYKFSALLKDEMRMLWDSIFSMVIYIIIYICIYIHVYSQLMLITLIYPMYKLSTV